MKLFLFREGDSFLHRLNPLSKLAMNVPLWVALSLVTDPVTPTLFIALASLTLWLLGGITPYRQARLLWPIWPLAAGIVATFALFQQPSRPGYEVLWQAGWLRVTDEGLLVGLSTALRVLALFSTSMLFVLTTDPVQLIRSLVQQMGLSYRFGYGILAAYRFIPLVASEAEQIRAAHHVRGYAPGWGLWGLWRRLRAFAIPLLAASIRRADRVALAMDSRAFGAARKRTYFKEQRFGAADVAFVVGAVVVGALVFYALWRLGLLGELTPFH